MLRLSWLPKQKSRNRNVYVRVNGHASIIELLTTYIIHNNVKLTEELSSKAMLILQYELQFSIGIPSPTETVAGSLQYGLSIQVS